MHGGTPRAATTTISGDLQASTWYYVIAKWSKDKSGDGTNYLSICADTTDGTTGCGVYPTAALGNWVEGVGVTNVGERNGATGSDFHVDEVRIYNDWL